MTETELLDPEEVAAGVRIVFDDDGTLTVEDGALKVAGEGGGTIFRWRCSVCGYIHEGPEPPRWCPLCGAEREMFEPEN